MDIYGLLMGLALLGAILAGLCGLDLWKYFVILIVVLIIVGFWINGGKETP